MINATQNYLMITLFYAMDQGKNHYTRSSIDKFLENLLKYHLVSIKRRWLFYCLRSLQDQHYISRRPRYDHDHNGLIRQYSSLRSFTVKGVLWLMSNGVQQAARLLRTMKDYWKREDGRFPTKDDFQKGYSPSQHPNIPKRLKQLLEGMLTSI